MTSIAPQAAPPAAVEPRARADLALRPGWMTVAAKEFADHLLSVRLYVLLIILGVAALIPLYFAGERIRALAPAASSSQAAFLALFIVGPEGNFGPFRFTADAFIALAAPLLGIGFAFDAVNGERHQGTLPRLLSQPIHRDDVINGKFAAGLAAITFGLFVTIAVIAGFGLLRLGILPALDEVVRVVAWVGLTVLYVSLWLAFGMLLSVLIRRAATSALVGFGAWLFVAFPLVGPLLAGLLGTFLASGATSAAEYYGTIQWVQRLLPGQLYAEATAALMNPAQTTVSASELYGGQYRQQMPETLLSFDQSFLLILPHIVVLLALTIGCFALAYTRFMRQEVRA